MRNKYNEQFEMVVSTGVVMVPSTGSGTEETVVELVETTEGTSFNKI